MYANLTFFKYRHVGYGHRGCRHLTIGCVYGVIEVKGVKPCVFRGHKPNDQSAYANQSFELCQMIDLPNDRLA